MRECAYIEVTMATMQEHAYIENTYDCEQHTKNKCHIIYESILK